MSEQEKLEGRLRELAGATPSEVLCDRAIDRVEQLLRSTSSDSKRHPVSLLRNRMVAAVRCVGDTYHGSSVVWDNAIR